MNLCKYKNILGEPGKGVHSYRIFNIAIVDVLLTLILLVIADLTIVLLPYWPYSIKRETLFILYNLIYISLYFAYTILYNFSFTLLL